MAGRHRRTPAPARHRKPAQRGHVLLPALAVAAVLGVGGVGASAALSGNGSTSHPHPAPTAAPMPSRYPSTAPVGPAAVRTAAPTTAPSSAPTTASAAALPGFALTVVRSVSWVQVIGPHGRVLYAGILRHGHTLTYPQRPLTVTIGDAGVVRLVLNHHAHMPAGRRGAVLRFVVR